MSAAIIIDAPRAYVISITSPDPLPFKDSIDSIISSALPTDFPRGWFIFVITPIVFLLAFSPIFTIVLHKRMESFSF